MSSIIFQYTLIIEIILFIVQQEGNIVCKLRNYMILCVNLMFPLNLEYEI